LSDDGEVLTVEESAGEALKKLLKISSPPEMLAPPADKVVPTGVSVIKQDEILINQFKLTLQFFMYIPSYNKVRELTTMCLPWQQWTETSVWFDDVYYLEVLKSLHEKDRQKRLMDLASRRCTRSHGTVCE
jgi:hypothetical protein